MEMLGDQYLIKEHIETPWGEAILFLNNEYNDKKTYESTETIKSGDFIDFLDTNREKTLTIKI